MEPVIISMVSLCRYYEMGDQIVKALDNINMEFRHNDYAAIMGPSGSGKSTLMNMIGCLDTPTSGIYELNGTNVAEMDDDELARVRNREIGFVFQEPRLMPWLTVSENIAFATCKGGMSKEKLPQLLATLGLSAFAGSYPAELSGGMAQRTALGRTLFQNPDIILMDEPFGALDYFTRKGLQETLLELFRKERKTIIFVTHDVEEAILLGERVLIMQKGSITGAIPVILSYPRDPAASEVLSLRRQILAGLE